ncbi:hypothetical protein EJB05_41651, partial [Eragrostis curvula]
MPVPATSMHQTKQEHEASSLSSLADPSFILESCLLLSSFRKMGSEASERTVVGWAATDAGGHLSPYTYTLRKTGPEDVVVKVLYCGVCHTDIHQVKNHLGSSNYPMVPGHEVVGELEEVGAAVTKYRAGDVVGVGIVVGCCRQCYPCKSSNEQYCNKKI